MNRFFVTLTGSFILFAFTCFAKPKLVTKNIKTKNINQNGFELNFKTDVNSAYSIVLAPINFSGEPFKYQYQGNFKQNHQFQFSNAEASQIFEATIKIYDSGADTLVYKKHYATASRSEGDIIVFFNHNVDVSFADVDNEANATGSALRDTLIAYIDRVEETLDIAIYNSFGDSPNTLIAGAINAAYNRGVDVRLIRHGSTSNTMFNFINENIPVLARPNTGIFPGLMHNKFVIADAHHQDANKSWVWTGSTNWTTAQIIGNDRNNVIVLYDQTLAQTFEIEFEEMWGSSGLQPNPTNAKFGAEKLDNTPKEFVIGGVEVECYFSPSDNTEDQIINVIEGAEHNVAVATMLITRQTIADALVAKFNEGVNDYALLFDTQNPQGSRKPFLMENIPLEHFREFTVTGQMHHKMMVADHGFESAVVLTGCHNWSAAANQRNDENTIIVYDQSIANQYYQAIAFMFGQVGGALYVEENLQEKNIFIYPNPASDFVSIKSNEFLKNITLTNLQGKVVFNKQYNVSEISTLSKLDLRYLNKGLYFITVETNKGVFSRKLIVE